MLSLNIRMAVVLKKNLLNLSIKREVELMGESNRKEVGLFRKASATHIKMLCPLLWSNYSRGRVPLTIRSYGIPQSVPLRNAGPQACPFLLFSNYHFISRKRTFIQ